jgi:AcrR family transcriptional regulator
MKPKPSAPPLRRKITPTQQRATETFECILEVSAQALVDVGFVRLSTNLVCERAGITPPALYRYFPNKYAILRELGERLMNKQDALIDKWINADVITAGVTSLEHGIRGLLLETFEVTRETVGGIWIMRAIRAVPLLQTVRMQSHERVTASQAAMLSKALPMVPLSQIDLVCRVVANLLHTSVEMLLEEPCEPEQVADIVAGMIAGHLPRMVAQSLKNKAN